MTAPTERVGTIRKAEMAIPKLEDWKAPWEKHGEEIDADKAKAFTHSLLVREEKMAADLEAANARANEAEQAKDVLQKQIDDAGATDDEKKQREQEATAKARQETESKAQAAEDRANRLEVAMEKGLTASQAKRLAGSTLEELMADADVFLKDLKPAGDEDDDGGDLLASRRRVVRNPLDPNNGGGGWDHGAALAKVPRPM